jgi:hypothetical protein
MLFECPAQKPNSKVSATNQKDEDLREESSSPGRRPSQATGPKTWEGEATYYQGYQIKDDKTMVHVTCMGDMRISSVL